MSSAKQASFGQAEKYWKKDILTLTTHRSVFLPLKTELQLKGKVWREVFYQNPVSTVYDSSSYMINFQGMCILYPNFAWANKTHFTMTEGDSANCNFPIYFSVFGLIFYGLATGLYNMYAVIRSLKDKDIGSQMWVMPFILINTLLGFTTLIVACIVSVGYLRFCEGMGDSDMNYKCSHGEEIRWVNMKTGKYFDSGPYTSLMTVAQIAAWAALLVWVLQISLSILRFVRNRRRRSAQMFNEAQASTNQTDKSRIAELEPTA